MCTKSTSAVYLIALALAGSLMACDSPTRPQPPIDPPNPPAIPMLVRIDVEGPGTIAPGEAVQFTASVHYSDGSRRNVTSDPETTWRTSDTRILAISSTGLATGGNRGDASVTLVFGARSATKGDGIVVPAGTFRLTGTLTDSGIGLAGVRVEVTLGSATGLVTEAFSTYRLYGVSGDTEIRVTKEGYQEERRRMQITRHETANLS
jgi:hypothetical protein